MEDEKYENFINFFEMDKKIKELLMKCAPTQEDNFNLDSKIQYYDKLNSSLKDFKYMFNSACKIFDNPIMTEKINNFFDRISEELINVNTNDECNKIYSKLFSNMRKEYVDNIKDNYFGSSIFRNEPAIITNAKTVNELLHGLHSDVLNNDLILEKLPKIDEKKIFDIKGIECSDIVLFGKNDNPLPRKIFEMFCNIDINEDRYNGFAYVVSADNKILIMARDTGHATTLEIDTSETKKNEKGLSNNIMVNYFIPKVINIDEIKSLPGVNSINEKNATGSFVIDNTKYDENEKLNDTNIIASKIMDFIYRVPMDGEDDLSVEDFKRFSKEKGIFEEWTMDYQYKQERDQIEKKKRYKETIEKMVLR